MRRSSEDIDRIIRNVNERGRLVLDLSQVVEDQIDRLRGRERGDTDTEEGDDGVRRFPRSPYGVEGYGRSASPMYNEETISEERLQEIMNNPPEYIEFVYQNRRFKLVPVGTIDPVPKDIHQSSRGSLYYYKTRDSAGNRLPMSEWTKVYLKRDQRQQCLLGGSQRTQGMGLAGLLPGNNVCMNQPEQPRRRAARPPRKDLGNQRRRNRRNESSDSSNTSSSD